MDLDDFLSLNFKYFTVVTALIRHQRCFGANPWGALDAPLEVREALGVDDLKSKKGLAQSAAFLPFSQWITFITSLSSCFL